METKQTDDHSILWKVHCSSPPSKLYFLVSSSEGRRRFWAESAEEKKGYIHFIFPNGVMTRSRIIEKIPDKEFSLVYFNTTVTFRFSTCGEGGTDVILINNDVSREIFEQTQAGWVSVLLALKACADFGIDLRNHNPNKSWDDFFVDN